MSGVRPLDASHPGLHQRVADELRRLLLPGHFAEELLVLDMPGRRIDSLQCQVERLVVIDGDAVVVDRRTNPLGRPRLNGAQHERRAARWKTQHCAARIVGNPHNVQLSAAVVEELAHGRAQAGTRPGLAKPALKVAETADENRGIERATKCTADKSCRRLWRHIDGLVHRCDFGDRDATINCI